MMQRPLVAAFVAIAGVSSVAGAQHGAIASWISFDAPIGLEGRTTPGLLRLLTQASAGAWHSDALGNLVLRKGSGSPRRVVACAIDRPGHAVTQITTDGYLRLHRVGNVAHPL